MMPDFSIRSFQKELLDEEKIPQRDLHRNLFELDVINRKLGGHAATLRVLDKLRLQKGRTYTVLDIGSGGGDTLKAIAAWGKRKGITLELTGVDIKADCIQYAEASCSEYGNIRFVKSDYRDPALLHHHSYDFIITSLFCHHLGDEELEALFSWSAKQARHAFIMNDLHRHPLAYYSIALLTALFSKSHLVKNDARLSVLRGFKRPEIKTRLQGAGISPNTYSLTWNWAFRWVLCIKPLSQE